MRKIIFFILILLFSKFCFAQKEFILTKSSDNDIMLDGINDSIKDAQELIKLIKPFRAKINLIPFNPWPGSNYKASSPDQIQIFKIFFHLFYFNI